MGILNGRLVAVQAATAELFNRGLLTSTPDGRIHAHAPRRHDEVSALQEGVLRAVHAGYYPLHSAPELTTGLNALQDQAVKHGWLRATPRTWRSSLRAIRTTAASFIALVVLAYFARHLADNTNEHTIERDLAIVNGFLLYVAAGLLTLFAAWVLTYAVRGPRRRTGKARSALRRLHREVPAPSAQIGVNAAHKHLGHQVALHGLAPLLAAYPASAAFGWRNTTVPAPHAAVPPTMDNQPQTTRDADGWSSAQDATVSQLTDEGAWHPEQIAILNGHLTAVQTAMASLVARGICTTTQRGGLHINTPHPLTPLTRLEAAVIAASHSQTTHIERDAHVRKALGRLQKDAVAAKLLRAPKVSFLGAVAGVIFQCFATLIVCAPIGTLIEPFVDDPEGYNAIMMGLIGIAGVLIVVNFVRCLFTRVWRGGRPRRTEKGIEALARLRGVHRPPFTLPRPDELPYAVALYGSRPLLMALPALAALGWIIQDIPDPSAQLGAQFHHSSGGACGGGTSSSDEYTDDAWCSAGDSCGSSGCGGGDGGCGGCGGGCGG